MPEKMYVCILNHRGKVVVHQNIKTDPELFFELIFPFIEDVVVGVECVFCWYWPADLCADHHIDFVLGHALYMKAIHGGKTKNDKIDSYKIAMLLKGGNFPTAYPYPAKWRATRDLFRRRMYISRRCSELVKWAVKEAAILVLRGSAEAKYGDLLKPNISYTNRIANTTRARPWHLNPQAGPGHLLYAEKQRGV